MCDEILKLIKERFIIPPIIDDEKILKGWMAGYSDCQNDVIRIIDKYIDDLK